MSAYATPTQHTHLTPARTRNFLQRSHRLPNILRSEQVAMRDIWLERVGDDRFVRAAA